MGRQAQTAKPDKAATAKSYPRISKAKSRGPVPCVICNLKIARAGDMARHVRTHYSPTDKAAAMHHCPVAGCDYQNLQKSNVKTHALTHSDENPLKCPDCSFENKDPASMLRHRGRRHGHEAQPRAQRDKPRKKLIVLDKNGQVIETEDSEDDADEDGDVDMNPLDAGENENEEDNNMDYAEALLAHEAGSSHESGSEAGSLTPSVPTSTVESI